MESGVVFAAEVSEAPKGFACPVIAVNNKRFAGEAVPGYESESDLM